MGAAGPSSRTEEPRQREVVVSISVRTILLVGAAVALAWALASIGHVLLLILVSIFSVAVLTPVVDVMERRLRWGRAICSSVLVIGLVVLVAVALLILLRPLIDGVRAFSNNFPRLVSEARDSDLGRFINGGSNSVDTLRAHAGAITGGAAKVSGGVANVGISAFGVVTFVLSLTFLTLFGLVELPRTRATVGALLYRDKRERVEQVTDRIITTTSRYMLGNLAISMICASVYGITAVILGLPYALALALISGILDLIPNVGALLAGLIIGIVALSVSLGALVAFVIVIFVYQQVENYVLQPTIIGKATNVSGFTVLVSVLVFGSLFGIVGAIIGVPIAAAIEIVIDESTSSRRALIDADDATRDQSA
jgi:predicted PurR-regulated permease PerM